jgi:hypothetical protein
LRITHTCRRTLAAVPLIFGLVAAIFPLRVPLQFRCWASHPIATQVLENAEIFAQLKAIFRCGARISPVYRGTELNRCRAPVRRYISGHGF